MRLCIVMAAIYVLLVWAGEARAADPYASGDPYWILLHEPAVIEELKLSPTQGESWQKLLDQLDLRFFPLRNKSREEGLPVLAKIVAEARQGLATILSPAQERRLNEILMRRLGTAALVRDDVAAKMRYSDSQRKEIQRVIDETQRSVTSLETEASEGKPREPLEKKFVELKTDEQKKIIKLLKPNQQAAWRELVGSDFEMSRLGLPAFKAPELVDTKEWINSSPLKLGELRGKVVVVHFYACGCSNCIHNYPWYRQWHDAFQGKEIVMIGIHTPETASERESANVRRKAAEEKLAFPILIDGKNENWNAWGNSMWPSVYLIDKRGYLRQFWPGELNWQGNQGEKFMREWIDKLLAEAGSPGEKARPVAAR